MLMERAAATSCLKSSTPQSFREKRETGAVWVESKGMTECQLITNDSHLSGRDLARETGEKSDEMMEGVLFSSISDELQSAI